MATDLGSCMSSVNDWCASIRLQLNTIKTEVMWYGYKTNLNKQSHDKLSKIGSDALQPTNQCCDLRVCLLWLGAKHEGPHPKSRQCMSCCYHLQWLRALCYLLGHTVTARLISAFILSLLDYCNAVLTGLTCVDCAQSFYHLVYLIVYYYSFVWLLLLLLLLQVK